MLRRMSLLGIWISECSVVWWAVTVDTWDKDSKCFWLTNWCTSAVLLDRCGHAVVPADMSKGGGTMARGVNNVFGHGSTGALRVTLDSHPKCQ
jgi:hypothetical protein